MNELEQFPIDCQSSSQNVDLATENVCPAARDWAKSIFEDDVAALLTSAASVARRITSAALVPLGISAREMAIVRILSHRSPLRQQEIGALLGIDRTSIVALVDSLESSRLLVRDADPTDRRANAVRLTEAGIAISVMIDQAILQAQAEILQDLTQGERVTLRSLLGKIQSSNHSHTQTHTIPEEDIHEHRHLQP